MKRTLVILLALALAVPQLALAFEMPEVRINGFVSQGYLSSDKHNFLTHDSVDGSTEFNEVGLTFNTDVDDKLHVGAQLLSRDLGSEGNNEVKLDWGYGDYRFKDWFGIRAGKIKVPLGLYNEGRDSDVLRSQVFLPQGLYPELWRDVVNAATGAGVYGNLSLGSAGDVDYNAIYGNVNIPENSYLNQGLLGLVNRQVGAPTDALSRIKFNNDHLAAGSLVYNTPLDGLRVGASLLEVEGAWAATYDSAFLLTLDLSDDMTPNGSFGPADMGMSDQIDIALKDYWVLSLEYAGEHFTLASEAFRYERSFKILGTPSGQEVDHKVEGAYLFGSAPLPFLPELSLWAMYDVYYDDADNHNHDYQKDTAFGVRYDVNPNWTIKAEYHDIEGTAVAYWYEDSAITDDDWNYYALKTSFNF